MKSIRTRVTLLTICAIIVAAGVSIVLGVVAIRSIGNSSADKTLSLLCEVGEKNLDAYFASVEQSVGMVSAYVEADLENTDLPSLPSHLDRVKRIFEKITYQTNGVLTYYYRIDPEVSEEAKGFWYVNLNGEGFQEHQVTDITLYDQSDTSKLVWFTVPKATGQAIWLPPYITDNLDVRVISYNVPIYKDDLFIGVVGIEIDYSTMAEQVNHITLYSNGYAFINDNEGKIIYHPKMDVTTMETQPAVPEGLLNDSGFARYTFDNVEKQAVWRPLENGMRLNVCVPVSEINEGWQRWIMQIVISSAVIILLFIFIAMHYTGQITKHLSELTEAARQLSAGRFDCNLPYHGEDEVGILTDVFNTLITTLKVHIRDLNDLAYTDSLTGLRNKGAFDLYTDKLQSQVDASDEPLEFAVCVFDCNDLKRVNDEGGHDKGDLYLRQTTRIICNIFNHSPVYRIGGDEFVTVLMNRDYQRREELIRLFNEECGKTRTNSASLWEKIDVSCGMAVYNPHEDKTVNDVVRRADRLMYENKWDMKTRRHT